MRFSEAVNWCIEHNAKVEFTHELTVRINVVAFDGFVEGYNFCQAVELAHARLVQEEEKDGEATSTLRSRDSAIEGE